MRAAWAGSNSQEPTPVLARQLPLFAGMRMEVLDTNPPAGDGLDHPHPALVRISPAATEVIAAHNRGTHPVAVYLARLAPGSRRTTRQALDVVAGLLTEGRADALTLPWPQLRYQHTQALRSRLAERYQPATVNKTLAALRGVLKEAWRLDLMKAETTTAPSTCAASPGTRCRAAAP